MGLEVEVRPAELDESVLLGEEPRAYVLRLAEAKARAVAKPGEVVLAADTTVVLDGEILGKPDDAAHARAMLADLAGRWHEVHTGVALLAADGSVRSTVVTSEVELARVDEAFIAWYVDTGEPLDKAGSYGLQGIGAALVRQVRGSVSNVIGLPLAELAELLDGRR